MSNKLPRLNRDLCKTVTPTERILQFGTGNFLKGFVNAIVNDMNLRNGFDAGVVAIKLRPGNQSQIDRINAQEGLFTLNVRGVEKGQVIDRCELIGCQTRAINPYEQCAEFFATALQSDIKWVVSNTTEAGIYFDEQAAQNDTPALSFPAKFTQWLYTRFQHFAGHAGSGVNVICCELIENNAYVLRDTIVRHISAWALPDAFKHWLLNHCGFFNSLVDRIVPGRPSDDVCTAIQNQQGYCDDELLEVEPYCLWAIQVAADKQLEFTQQFPTSGIQGVVISDDLAFYRERKVRLLNGPHTATANVARLLGIDTVYQATCDARVSHFMQSFMQDDVLPLLAGEVDELNHYSHAIYQRFTNPFLKHEWRAISMNSLSKWRARLLPLVKSAAKQGKLPVRLVASMVGLLCLYRNPALVNDGDYQPELFASLTSDNAAEVVPQVLAQVSLWGEDLNALPRFTKAVISGVEAVLLHGIEQYLDEQG